MNVDNLMWPEKYRPKKIDDMVLSQELKDKLKTYLKNHQSLPHFLLYSKAAGTGKTTLAKAIINELGCDKLILNSSSDRKIETIRAKVKNFALTKSSVNGMRRCVFLDEFDGMLKASQDALRNVMETYASNVFFILTCNNVNKIIEPLQSRCIKLPFARPHKHDIYKYLEEICKKENMNCTEDGLNKLIDLNYPSIRNCVVTLQDLNTQGVDVKVETVAKESDDLELMWKKLQEKDWKFIKEKVMATTIDPQELNSYFWRRALESENIKLIQLTCRNERDISFGSDPKIVLVTSLIEMVK